MNDCLPSPESFEFERTYLLSSAVVSTYSAFRMAEANANDAGDRDSSWLTTSWSFTEIKQTHHPFWPNLFHSKDIPQKYFFGKNKAEHKRGLSSILKTFRSWLNLDLDFGSRKQCTSNYVMHAPMQCDYLDKLFTFHNVYFQMEFCILMQPLLNYKHAVYVRFAYE